MTVLKGCGMIAVCLGFSLLMVTVAGAELACSLGASSYYDPGLDRNASPDALRIARNVAGVLCSGACNVALIRNPTAGNVLTAIAPDGTAKVVYNPQFLTSVDKAIGDGAIFGIFAHEVGHIIDGRSNVAWMPGSWDRELRADAWAGCALARATMPDDKTTAALRAILRYPSPAHPARSLRVPALELGYHSCGGTGNLPGQETD